MNFYPAQDLSVYQLAVGVKAPLRPSPISPATLLSLLRSQIDLLIEQQITATLWVKLPPGQIWQSELTRYQSSVSGVIYTLHLEDRLQATGRVSFSSTYNLQIHPNSQLRREYFLIVLSPQFCSLISVRRSRKPGKKLLAVNTFETRVIQQVLDGFQQGIAPETSPILPTDFLCPSVETLHTTSVLSQLLTKQFQRQNEINRQIINKLEAKAQRQYQKLNKALQVKDEYLSRACQELRTPLTHMKTALSLLNSSNLKSPQRQRYLQMVNTECDRQNSLITGLLDLVQLDRNLEATTLEAVHLSDIVPGVVSTYQPLAQEKGIMLAYTVPIELPAVWCVSGWLRQIVINLLHNSIKFTPNGGQVWVRSHVRGDYVHLQFRDTGIGIPESEIPKIFDSFYRVRPIATEDSSGSGLGLTIVQQLLLRCGGSIFVNSKLSQGSTFTVQLASVFR